MKLRNIFFLMLSVLLVNCSDDDNDMTLSQDDFSNVKYDQQTLEVQINTAQEWTATSLVPWCEVSDAVGKGNATLVLTLQPNIGPARTGKVVIWTEEGQEDIEFSQEAYTGSGEFHYQLPVVFHVLYKDNTPAQKITRERLVEVLAGVNKYFKGESKWSGGEQAQDMNLEFVIADKDEAGETTNGVEYIQVADNVIDCDKMMSDAKYIQYLWNPNKYINVFIYEFKAVQGGMILGVTHLPQTVRGQYALPGLNVVKEAYLTKSNLNFPKCVSLNSKTAYQDTEAGAANPNGLDFIVTAAHELGHYLGLHHAFNEDTKGACIDTDYCEDTPPYDREYYMAAYLPWLEQQQQNTFANAAKRIDCRTEDFFTSYNLMDYEFGYMDRFTTDQRTRVRNVLMYSPLIPGPKIYPTGVSTRAVEGVLDIPYTIVK